MPFTWYNNLLLPALNSVPNIYQRLHLLGPVPGEPFMMEVVQHRWDVLEVWSWMGSGWGEIVLLVGLLQ